MAIHSNDTNTPYVGRFAPSPTGLLHFGSLVTAVASYLDAKENQGQWLVRIEDLDPPRETPGAITEILRTLEAYHLHWDGEVWQQSTRHDIYQAQIDRFITDQKAFYCTCSRKPLIRKYGHRYPGICRGTFEKPSEPSSIRLLTHDTPIGFEDGLQGHFEQCLESELGDFIIKRKDDLYAYHIAVVMDDEAQGVTDIVRGLDLLDSTPRHLYLQQLLNYRTPNYVHLPLITNQLGQKLSKQTFAEPIPNDQPSHYLWTALSALGQHPPIELESASPQDILEWGVANWKMDKIPKQSSIPEADLNL